ncbi:hypothetical protein F0562_019722 [Nyssa sinensis]|uniref:Protein TIFY n=1 Tax=Nyssa sinensis TaxID=561372 RepID=A0A5J5BP00_9ASTE|nr:hypothetical protein F0562_019722 [Nyssa sinensis]
MEEREILVTKFGVQRLENFLEFLLHFLSNHMECHYKNISYFLQQYCRTEPSTGSLMTIFYKGRVCVCDVTELQARAIIWLARRGMEEKVKIPGVDLSSPSPSPSPLPYLLSQLCVSPGVPLKRSLQRFLQKRKDRIKSISPYNH